MYLRAIERIPRHRYDLRSISKDLAMPNALLYCVHVQKT